MTKHYTKWYLGLSHKEILWYRSSKNLFALWKRTRNRIIVYPIYRSLRSPFTFLSSWTIQLIPFLTKAIDYVLIQDDSVSYQFFSRLWKSCKQNLCIRYLTFFTPTLKSLFLYSFYLPGAKNKKLNFFNMRPTEEQLVQSKLSALFSWQKG